MPAGVLVSRSAAVREPDAGHPPAGARTVCGYLHVCMCVYIYIYIHMQLIGLFGVIC